MARARVLSFMSTFGGPPRSPTEKSHQQQSPVPRQPDLGLAPPSVSTVSPESPLPAAGRQRASSRPISMIGGYQPPIMKIASDTIPELAPIFTFLNSHSNKLYQEGYFLKLNDLDSHGRPYPDRLWTECFAQLVGTVLSLWDASALDAAGEEGEVAPTFINLADASIKMVETLPTRSQDTQPLTNVLSISTAGKNRYLFHFSTVNALTQWTAGLRLAMFENASLQEAYTGALIAGKGKSLNNIKTIMERTRFKTEEWTRVRFGAGTPWRRCWCVVSPPDEKEVAVQKKALKKKSAYDRSTPILKGNIKFYDTKKTKKATPIATIRDAYSAYAIYPQSKPLIEQSTLIKIEGVITIHTKPEVTTEGFIFVMPEVHPAISGFEMMLRFIFPIYDAFALYGRPTRLVADTLDARSLMFAMPQEKRYGYLEIFDIATLIHTAGSQSWSEREWKKQLKQLTSQRIGKMSGNRSRPSSKFGSRHGHRNSLPSRAAALNFQDGAPTRSTPSLHQDVGFAPLPPAHSESAPPANDPFLSPRKNSTHQRSASEAMPISSPQRQQDPAGYTPSRLSYETSRPRTPDEDAAPVPPVHVVPIVPVHQNTQMRRSEAEGHQDRSSSESERIYTDAQDHAIGHDRAPDGMVPNLPPSPVAAPPAFAHGPGAKPQARPYQAPELRRANSRMSSATLSQLAAAGNAGAGGADSTGGAAAEGAAAAWRNNQYQEGRNSEDLGNRGVNDYNNTGGNETTADSGMKNKGMVLDEAGRTTLNVSQAQPTSAQPLSPSQHTFLHNSSENPPPPPYTLHTLQTGNERSASPLSQAARVPDNTEPDQQLQQSAHQADRLPLSTSTNLSDSHASQPSSQADHRMSIARKPVPGPPKQFDPPRPTIDTSTDSSKFVMDQSAFNRVHTMKSIVSTESESRRNSGDSSRYDPDSAVSPDYASTQESIVPSLPPNPDRPRVGVLKTVGDLNPSEQEVVIGDARYRPASSNQPASDSWNVDFGPTQLYIPGVKKQPPARPMPEDKPVRRNSSELLGPAGKGRVSPGHVIDAYNRSPNRSHLVTPEPGPSRPDSTGSGESPRNMVWQPGATLVGSSQPSRQSITPEQFVQQRAAASRVTPVYAHSRQSSATTLGHARQSSGTPPLLHGRRGSRTPPLSSRNSSGDWSGQFAQQGMSARPVSAFMSSAPDFSAHLSAREQEHVARVTGSPLIKVAGKTPQANPPSGLIGAIEAREREKKDMKAGIQSSMMVQQAIAQQRQQQAQKAQAFNYPQPSPRMHVPGQYPPSPQMYDHPWGNQQQDYMQGYQATPQQQYVQKPHPKPYGNTGPPQQGYQQPQYTQQGQYQQYPSPQGQFSNQPNPQQGGGQHGR